MFFLVFERFCCVFAWVLNVFHGNRCCLCGFFVFACLLVVYMVFLMVFGSAIVIVVIHMVLLQMISTADLNR